jgi:hypothetical protein
VRDPVPARITGPAAAGRSAAIVQAIRPWPLLVLAVLAAATLVYAFRIAGEKDATWYGEPELRPSEPYKTVPFSFVPSLPRPPFSGWTLEFRFGRMSAKVLPGHLRAYPLIGNRRIGMTAATQQALFGA